MMIILAAAALPCGSFLRAPAIEKLFCYLGKKSLWMGGRGGFGKKSFPPPTKLPIVRRNRAMIDGKMAGPPEEGGGGVYNSRFCSFFVCNHRHLARIRMVCYCRLDVIDQLFRDMF
ncbi:hypothetical protein LX32DRAFT_406616 [Colletotrichum zoysiae]|uniref:Secreted protein n=1 Tax=Colletotrichum zoysiae TaxID=1216348 RepID=A0AAD9HHJ4_9PEZI|nr:hypothetical protein LX32DRAFT_406616 [Colletotrichum zoysiae]